MHVHCRILSILFKYALEVSNVVRDRPTDAGGPLFGSHNTNNSILMFVDQPYGFFKYVGGPTNVDGPSPVLMNLLVCPRSARIIPYDIHS